MITTIEQIKTNITNNKEISKIINGQNYYTIDSFISEANRYIAAIEQRRMINTIKSVSKSGMNRTIQFVSMETTENGFYLSNYVMLFSILGFKKSRTHDFCFTIGGCGMDMIFQTNYTIIHDLFRLGFIDRSKCDTLAQMTPTTI